MRISLIFLIVLISCSSNLSSSEIELSDNEIRNWIVDGHWVKDPDGSDYGTEGRMHIYWEHGNSLIERHKTHECINAYAWANAAWNVNNGILELVIERSNNKSIYPLGKKIQHRVTKINHKVLQLEGSNGHVHNYIRDIAGCIGR